MLFHTESILSKWGFDDGDMLDDLLWDNGIELDDKHKLLIKVVREKVLPEIKQHVEVFEIGTIHNPIRAESVDGVKVDNYGDNPNIHLLPESVEVDDAEILRMARAT